MDAQGQATYDPRVAVSGSGRLLPIGGLHHGHKGYGVALLVEALTQSLSGFGRHTLPGGMLMNVFLQSIDPDAFGRSASFEVESTWLFEACAPIHRDRASARYAYQGNMRWPAEAKGVPLSSLIVDALGACMARRGLLLT
ncbi:Ldh family oxidoreductase [Variovorax rhizosphaerae]|uniref:Ldh family oxidoreductase n=1 Tax=Variovorax rhizosphaerae TaxID=1836200 RepID=A0ABU8WJM4_9BURK